MSRNAARYSAIKPRSTKQTLAVAHAIYLAHDGESRPGESDLAATSFGTGHVAPANLAMIGTLGTALSANPGWLTLTGASNHCFAATMSAAIQNLYHADGGLLLFAQGKASISTNTNGAPHAIGIGNRDATAGEAFLGLGVNRAGATIRIQYNSDGDTTMRTTDGNSPTIADDTEFGIAVYYDFAARTYDMFLNGALNKSGGLDGSAGNTFAGAFNPANTKNRFSIGGGWANASTSYPAATLWEDQLRRVGAIGFSETPGDLEALLAELHAARYVPFGLFDGEA